jgi:ParB family chromosome partitioning protein
MSSHKSKERLAADDLPRPRLGRGLAALLADTSGPDPSPEIPGREQKTVPVEFLRPNPRNPRRQFDSADLHDLTESIRAKGIIQPIIVRSIKNVAGSFEIIAGERRWRAAQAAQLHDVPVVVVEADDREALAFAIIENVQRADLNAIEEARGYERLANEFAYSQTELSAMIGKSRSHVANTLRLLKLPASVVDLVIRGELSAGHARALLAFPDPEPVARRIVEQGLTVRDVEALAQAQHAARTEGEAQRTLRPARTVDPLSHGIAKEFSAVLGLPVTHSARGEAGEIRIRYTSPEELKALRERLASRG